MRSLETIFLGAAALVRANPSNPCLNDEDEIFPDPKGDEKLRKLTLTQCLQIAVRSTSASLANWWDTQSALTDFSGTMNSRSATGTLENAGLMVGTRRNIFLITSQCTVIQTF